MHDSFEVISQPLAFGTGVWCPLSGVPDPSTGRCRGGIENWKLSKLHSSGVSQIYHQALSSTQFFVRACLWEAGIGNNGRICQVRSKSVEAFHPQAHDYPQRWCRWRSRSLEQLLGKWSWRGDEMKNCQVWALVPPLIPAPSHFFDQAIITRHKVFCFDISDSGLVSSFPMEVGSQLRNIATSFSYSICNYRIPLLYIYGAKQGYNR